MDKLTERLNDAARSGVYRVLRPDEALDATHATQLDLARVDFAGATGKEALLAHLGRALGFPDWFGGNWDALEDCLTDLSWRTGAGHVLLIERQGAFSVGGTILGDATASQHCDHGSVEYQIPPDARGVNLLMWHSAAAQAWQDTLHSRLPPATEASADSTYDAGEVRLFQHIIVTPGGSTARDTTQARDRIAGYLAQQQVTDKAAGQVGWQAQARGRLANLVEALKPGRWQLGLQRGKNRNRQHHLGA